MIFLRKGKIRGKTEKGTKTIEVCKLSRKTLRIARKKLIDDSMRSFMIDVKAFKKGEIDERGLRYNIKKQIFEIVRIYAENQPYSMLARTMLLQFDAFFVNRFQPADRIHFSTVYQELKEKFGNL